MANEEKEKVNETEEQEAVEAEVIDAAPSEESETNNEGSERLTQLEQEKNEMYDRLLRLQAEYDNFRKRTQKEKEAASKYRSCRIWRKLCFQLSTTWIAPFKLCRMKKRIKVSSMVFAWYIVSY